ncbi:hypothetical protein M9458_049305, partial [Cirrhinus mrigala]
EKNAGFCSRLIIILDTDNSLPWVKEVQKIEGLYVAVQGAVLSSPTDPEVQDVPQLGDFTCQWVDFNCNPDSIVRWSERGRPVRAAYGISRHWSDYKLHLPTESDVTRHWRLYFPPRPLVRWVKPLLGLRILRSAAPKNQTHVVPTCGAGYRP